MTALCSTYVVLCSVFMATSAESLLASMIRNKLDEAGHDSRNLVNINGTTYFFSKPKGDIITATMFCADYGMTLAGFETEEEFRNMQEFLKESDAYQDSYWTSLTYYFNDFWIWTNSNRVITGDSRIWSSPPRNPTREYCGYIAEADILILPCMESNQFLCEVPTCV